MPRLCAGQRARRRLARGRRRCALEADETKSEAEIDARYEKKKARDGQFYFVLKAGNGEVVGVSETYTSVAARDGGIAAVKVNAGAAAWRGKVGELPAVPPLRNLRA
jgi:uncharacterized protein YegP (UPF0339 family)